MPVADTCFLVDLMRRKPEALALYSEYEDKGIALATTAITALELFKGAYISSRSENVLKVKAVLGLFDSIPIDDGVYDTFGICAANLMLQGRPIGDFDELIAAMAICHDGELITRDGHFSNLPGLAVISY